ncbi:MAG: hypothetical protein LBO09_03250 [Candidatus Peribacteria bacterium]|nr:hypothetical protein [Candidatus Peribacteria bacterium]
MVTIGGASILAQSEDTTVNLSTNLANPIQHIERIIFMIPNADGSWKSQ